MKKLVDDKKIDAEQEVRTPRCERKRVCKNTNLSQQYRTCAHC